MVVCIMAVGHSLGVMFPSCALSKAMTSLWRALTHAIPPVFVSQTSVTLPAFLPEPLLDRRLKNSSAPKSQGRDEVLGLCSVEGSTVSVACPFVRKLG